MQKKSTVVLIPIFITVMVIVLTGCSSLHARREEMTVTNIEIKHQHANSIYVNVLGGESASVTEPTLTAEEFKEALKTSIVNWKIFSELINNSSANYLLEVNIINVSDPPRGADMRVTLVTNWKLTSLSTKKIIWQEIISSSYTATVGDALGGITRVRIAIEGASRENIRKGVEKISALSL